MPHTHDDAVLGFGRDLKAGRQLFTDRVERVVAAHPERLRQTFKYIAAHVMHQRWLAVHRIVEHSEFPSICFDHSLKAKAHAEHRNVEFGRITDEIGYAEVAGASG